MVVVFRKTSDLVPGGLFPPPMPLSPSTSSSALLVRLNKLLVRQGLCSRREADAYIAAGWVSVDGWSTSDITLGAKVSEDALVTLSPEACRTQSHQRTILFHKPLGVVSCQPEGSHQIPAIRYCTTDGEHVVAGACNRSRNRSRERSSSGKTLLPSSSTYYAPPPAPQSQSGWRTAGRLDVNSTGLLVLTQSGRIASQIIGGSNRQHDNDDDNPSKISHAAATAVVEKEYLVRVPNLRREPSHVVHEKLERLTIDGGFMDENNNEFLSVRTMEQLNDDQLRIVLTEGRHHHIRRLCRAVEWDVQALKRVRIGGVRLADLPLGRWRYLQPHERFVVTTPSVDDLETC